MFRSWSLAVQILVRERLEARCEELEFQTGNRPTTLATMKKHKLVEAAMTELFWSTGPSARQWAISFAGTPPRRYRVEEIKELAVERNISTSGPDGKPLVKEALIRDLLRWCERQPQDRNGAARSMCSGRADQHDDRLSTEHGEFPETPTGDGRRCLHDLDGSKTLTSVLGVLGSSRGRTSRQILSRTWDGLSKGSKQASPK